jgi:hypothetical protein
MKKLLLVLVTASLAVAAQAQLFFNQVFTARGNNSQFFELYNPGVTPSGIDADCYSVITYYRNGSEEGFYVLDLPRQSVSPQGVMALSSGSATGMLNWNRLPDGASLKRFAAGRERGAGYTSYDVNTQLDEFFSPYERQAGQDLYAAFLFNGSALSDAFINGTSLPGEIAGMPDLSYTNSCGMPVTISFRSLQKSYPQLIAQASAAFVRDQGYFRRSIGRCGEWYGALRVADDGTIYNSGFGLRTRYNCYDRSLQYEVQRYASTTNAYTIRLYADRAPYGILGTNDLERGVQQPVFNSTSETYTFNNITDEFMILVLDAPGECYDIVRPVRCAEREQQSPVNFTQFDVQRNNANVQVAWQTALHHDNRGYEVQRRYDDDTWSTIAYVVPDVSAEVKDQDVLRYMYGDQHPELSRTVQYRVKIISRDGRYGYSDVRTVPTATVQSARVMVYPNPSTDGRIYINFGNTRSLWDVQVVDMNGRIVNQWRSLSTNSHQIDNIRPGHYLLRLVNRETGMVTTEKVIVAR